MNVLRFDALTKSFARFPTKKENESTTAGPAIAGPERSSRRRFRARSAEICPANRVACDGSCLNPWVFGHDARNCGACGNTCPHGTVCCEGRCADLTTDLANCGSCGNTCPGIGICLVGECV